MSESTEVVVVCSQYNKTLIPQEYDSLNIVYSPSQALSIKEQSDFYNSIISSEQQNPKDIYGFVPLDHDFTSKKIVSTVVDFFNQDTLINVVITDFINKYSTFSEYHHSHPHNINDPCTIFIRGSLLKNINFSDSTTMFPDVIQQLVQQREIIFHIAEPLMTNVQESAI